MIRFLFALLLIQASLISVVSCSSKETSNSLTPIEDDGSSAALAANNNSKGEDELENEFDKESAADSNTPAQAAQDSQADQLDQSDVSQAPDQAAATADSDDQSLEKDLDTQDLQAGPSTNDQSQVQSDQAPSDQAPSVEAQTPPEEAPAAPVAPAPAPVPEKAHIQDIRYVANSTGGTVLIQADKPVSYQTRVNPTTHQFIVEMANVELPSSLQRPYLMKEFGSRFGSINAYQDAGSDTARVVIQMTGDETNEPIVQQEGNSLVVIPPTAPPVAQQTPTSPATPKAATSSSSPLAARTLDEFLTGNQKFFGRRISIQVKDADVRDAINFVADQSGANIVISDDVKGHISLKLRRVPWDQALVTIMRAKGLGYVRQGNVLRISTLKELEAEAEVTRKILDSEKKIVPAVVQVIPVSYAAIKDLVKSIEPFLTPKLGKVVADKRTSTVIVTDTADVVERVEKLVKTLDVPPAQVSIESKIVEAAEGFENFVGVNWAASGSQKQLSAAGGADGAPITLSPFINSTSLTQDFIGGSPFSAGINVGTLDTFGNLSASLTLAEQDSLAKVISAPRISTMNRQKATITQDGENVAVITTVDKEGNKTKTEKRTPFSLSLSVTPQITSDGAVIMALDVKRQYLGPVVDPQLGSRAVNTRTAKTTIMVRNGQTAVIGGIYTSEDKHSSNGVPGLKDIPVLGWLFKSRSIERTKNELLVFMTPRILDRDSMGTQASMN